MPTSPPPGTTKVNAVDAWVNGSACGSRSPGSATIHGGAYVTMFSTVATGEREQPGGVETLTTAQTSPIVGDPRQDDARR